MRKLWLILVAILFPLAVMAQSAADISRQESDDRGFLTRLLERNLSDAGRQVVIEGFNGALSSRATFRRITIADDNGVWITLNDGAIQWNRAALLRGRIEIAELAAREILLPRLPVTQQAPSPEAREFEFALPELPVGNQHRTDPRRTRRSWRTDHRSCRIRFGPGLHGPCRGRGSVAAGHPAA